jgi:branched-chain amino acid transport system permease protein
MGIDVNRIYAITFGLGTACVGLAAAVLSPLYPAFPTVGSFFVLTAFVVVVLGGMGSLPGAVIGALIIGLVDSLAGYYVAPDLKEVVYFAIFLGILILRPAGLFGVRGNE